MFDKIKSLFKDIKVNEELAKKYKNVFSTKEGEEVLKDLLIFCEISQPTFKVGQPDLSAFNEGKRRVGLRLLSLTEANLNKDTK